MFSASQHRLAALGVVVAALLMTVFALLVLQYSRELRSEIRQRMIERDAAVLYPVAQQQLDATALDPDRSDATRTLLSALLPSAGREGLLAMAIFDADGVTLEKVPSDQVWVELPFDDYIRLQNGRPIARFTPEFSLQQLFPRNSAEARAPVLEIVLPLRDSAAPASSFEPLGFVRYHIDARGLASELAALDHTVRRQTTLTLTLGLASIAGIVAAACFGLRRAQRIIAERNERLQRANFELTLAAKASALGQITSHLIHGLQGPVAGLRAMVTNRDDSNLATAPDWATAADYTERMQTLIQETVALLGDASSQTSYELTGHELVEIVRQRNLPVAIREYVILNVRGGFDATLDSHRGGLLCLIVSNLVQNSIAATEEGRDVNVVFRTAGRAVTVDVSDEGGGISEELLARLFEPGHSGRPGGSGLGLAISQLLARQIGATLELVSTGPNGTTFRLTLPL